jgi:hypothetical protein
MNLVAANELLERWLEGRPDVVKQLAHEFPPGTKLEDPDGAGTLYVVGYNENGMLVVSGIDPTVDYEGAAHGARAYVCASHYRGKRQ